MIKRTLAICAVAAIAMMGCAEPVEPNNDNGDNNMTSANNTTPTNTGNNTSTNNTTPDPCAGVVCNTPPVDTCEGTVAVTYMNPGMCVDGECVYSDNRDDCAMNNEICENAECMFDPDAPCPMESDFEGQIGADRAGGVFSTSDAALEDDAGIAALRTQIAGLVGDGTIDGDVNSGRYDFPDGSEPQIMGAMVTSTNRDVGMSFQYTIQDKQSAIIIRFAEGENVTSAMNGAGETVDVFKVGQKVSFTVDSVQAFGGTTPQIALISNVMVDAEEQDVFVQDRTGQAVTIEDWGKLVKIVGKITGVNNPTCGGSNVCYDFVHGPEGATQTITLRSSSNFISEDGECGAYVGPVSSFPGPIDDGASPQIDTVNFDFYRGPFRDMN